MSDRIVRWALVLTLAAAAMEGVAGAAGIPNAAQIGATRTGTTDANWRVWARRSDGHLATASQDAFFGLWLWADRGVPSGTTLGTAGVATAWWLDGSNKHERAYTVAANGNLCEYALTNGVSGTWTCIAPPSGHSLTGNITALTGVDNIAHRMLIVAATMTDGDLKYAYKDVTLGSPWFWGSLATGLATNRPLTSSVDSSGVIWSIFATLSGDTTLLLARWSGLSWANTTQSTPPGGIPVCGSVDAAQGQLSPTLYRLMVLCTRVSPSESQARYLYFTAPDDTTGTWASIPISGGVTVDAIGNTVAAVERPDGSGLAIDAYYLGNNDHLLLFTRTASTTIFADRGVTGENNNFTDGGLVALREGTQNWSRAVFNGSLGGAYYLYTRAGSDTATRPWEALGAGEPVHYTPSIGLPHTESMITEWQGKMITAAIVRPGADPCSDYAYVQTTWSTDDGNSWGAWETITDNGMDYVTDPTVAMTDAGKAYVVVLGVDFPHTDQCPTSGDCSDDNPDYFRIYYVTTTNGSDFSLPVTVAEGTGLDHEWVGIDRTRTPDRLHFVWTDVADSYRIHYRYLDDGGDFGADTQIATGGGAPTLAVAPDGSVYLAWLRSSDGQAVRICKLNGSLTACDEAAPEWMEVDWGVDSERIWSDSLYMLGIASWNIQPSRVTPNRLYYLFQHGEAASAQKDIMFSVGDYNTSTRVWSWTRPVTATGVTEDARDQFNASLNIEDAGGGAETIHASWYDRREECSYGPNFCIRRKRSFSTTGLSFWFFQDSQTGPLTDPTLLPYHCCCAEQRIFIGDYQDGVGVARHSHHIWSEAPIGTARGEYGIAYLLQGFLSSSGFYY